MNTTSHMQMRRCEFHPIPSSAYTMSSSSSNDSSSEFDLKTEHSYEYEASTFFLPANVCLSLTDILPTQHSVQKSRALQNALPSKITVITSSEKTIEYGLSNSFTTSKYTLNSNLAEISSALYRTNPTTSSTSWADLLTSFSHAINDANSVIDCILNTQELLNESTIHQIQAQMTQIKSQIESSSKYYTYSLFTLDEHATYKEAYKGVSVNLASLLAGTPQAFAERILRFGDVDIFSTPSKANIAFSLISQIVNMQYYNHFGLAENKSIALQRLDDKQIVCNANSRIIPLTDRVEGVQDRSIFYAFMRITEIVVDENNNNQLPLLISEHSQTDLSLSSHSSSGNNSPHASLLEASEQHEEYLQSIQNFQAKYYGKGQMRKKRYRKTKAQVEEELKYYLALNMNQQQTKHN